MRVEKTKSPKSGKDWSEVECYFAVWGYDKINSGKFDTKASVVREVVDLTGRSYSSVEYKFMNCAACDEYTPEEEKPYTPMSHYQKLLKEVFDWYWENKEKARNRFTEFKTKMISNSVLVKEKNEHIPVKTKLNRRVLVEEGSITSNIVNMRKRSTALVNKARNYFRELDKDGKLRCYACGFFKPEEVRREIIHIHHKEPLMETDKDGRTIVIKEYFDKLVPLCPTCHAIAHSSRPPLNLEEIKKKRSTINE